MLRVHELRRQGCCAEARAHEEGVKQLEVRVNAAMDQPQNSPISFVELHDALTTLRFHNKPLFGNFDKQLLEDIEKVRNLWHDTAGMLRGWMCGCGGGCGCGGVGGGGTWAITQLHALSCIGILIHLPCILLRASTA